MKILKDNKNFGTVEFACASCGVVFSADRGEYILTKGKELENIGTKFFGSITTYEEKPCWYLKCECPACGNEVEIIMPREGQSRIFDSHGDW